MGNLRVVHSYFKYTVSFHWFQQEIINYIERETGQLTLNKKSVGAQCVSSESVILHVRIAFIFCMFVAAKILSNR